MQSLIKFSLPVYYTVERKRTKIITTKSKKTGKISTREVKDTVHLVGQNWFRNVHHHTKNVVKRHYHELVAQAVVGQNSIEGKYKTYFTYYYKNKGSDATNVIPQIEKFALDGLIEAGMIEEDNVLFNIASDGWEVCEDKLNPRLEIEIRSV
ncbi:MAG: hypothetical protein DRG78_02835 [Epsilonproteobacteria bacterium]|nr:MAG: hypothetical protein DRG78_02835 [Campylobacterota bacterium]